MSWQTPKKVAGVLFGLTVFCGLSYYFGQKITCLGHAGSLKNERAMEKGSQTLG